MQILLQKANVNHQKLKKYLLDVVGQELSNLSEPCYRPKLKKHQFNILMLCGLHANDIKDFTNRLHKGTPRAKWQLVNDQYTNLLIFCMHYFLKKKDMVGANASIDLIGIRYYTNLMEKNIPYCDPKAFQYALEQLKNNHLFKKAGDIGSAIYYLCRQVMARKRSEIEKGTTDGIVSLILELRHRIAQSIRSFQTIYYRVKEEGEYLGATPEGEEGYTPTLIKLSPDSKVVTDIVQKITVYRDIDQKAFEMARRMSELSQSTCKVIVKNLADVKYTEDLRVAVYLLLKDIQDLKKICSPQFFTYIKRLVQVKNLQGTYKGSIKPVFDDIVKKLRIKNKSKQYMASLFKFIAFYVAIVTRNTFCS